MLRNVFDLVRSCSIIVLERGGGSRCLTQPSHPAVLQGFSCEGSAHVNLSDNVRFALGFASSLLRSSPVSAGAVAV